MPERARQAPGAPADRNGRFDSGTVRRILQRAAEEQHRLDIEWVDSCTLGELEEMAAEARISPEALHAAIAAHRREASAALARRPAQGAGGRSRDWLARLEGRLPARWPPAVKGLVLTGGGVLGLAGLLLGLAVLAPTAFWVTSATLIALSLLALIGASPF